MAWLTMNSPANNTSNCQSINCKISWERIRRLISNTPAAPKARTSRGTLLYRNPATSSPRIKKPLVVCQRLNGRPAPGAAHVSRVQRPAVRMQITSQTAASPSTVGTAAWHK